ncbi:MAG: hypothetical protein HN392_09305 [Anaerolineae bacterium]|jgi:hypothetical protein|nr:hypothetical protein [Anaerolineae bacterium]MBT7990868.1 hypothetical protein [Anaerolineae bacterium]
MEVLINTSDIRNSSSRLKSRAADMEAAIQSAENAIAPLRHFKSPRIERDLAAWDEIKSTFVKNLESLLRTADELARAAADTEAANN